MALALHLNSPVVCVYIKANQLSVCFSTGSYQETYAACSFQMATLYKWLSPCKFSLAYEIAVLYWQQKQTFLPSPLWHCPTPCLPLHIYFFHSHPSVAGLLSLTNPNSFSLRGDFHVPTGMYLPDIFCHSWEHHMCPEPDWNRWKKTEWPIFQSPTWGKFWHDSFSRR